jgi:cytochrome c553
MIKKSLLILSSVLMIFLNSCYYDNVEDLYPQTDCDTANITFANDVNPIINNNCTGCHNNSFASGGVNLETYDNIVSVANNGSLMGVIKHESGWSPMPKNGNKLSDCDISKLEIWISDGTPNN